MKLNYDKCINLTINQHKSSVKYLDVRFVPRKHEAVYLGSLFTDTIDNHREAINQLADATTTCNQLKLFWNKAQNSSVWKLRVFDSIPKSKVLYGLEGIQLTTADISKINAVQMKGIRRIHIPPTFINRMYTNQKVLDITKEEYGISIERVSTTWKKRTVTLLGHIIRAGHDDPMRQVIFEPLTNIPRYEYKRPGKPRASWLQESFKTLFIC